MKFKIPPFAATFETGGAGFSIEGPLDADGDGNPEFRIEFFREEGGSPEQFELEIPVYMLLGSVPALIAIVTAAAAARGVKF